MSSVSRTDSLNTFTYKKKNSEKLSSSRSLEYSSSDSVTTSDEDEIDEEWKCLKNSQKEVEAKFNSLKNILCKEKSKEVDLKIVELRSGIVKDTQAVQVLKDQMESRLEVISALRRFKMQNLKHKHEAAQQEIIQNFENNKQILYDNIKADLEDQIKKIEKTHYEEQIIKDSSAWLGCTLMRSGRVKLPYEYVQSRRKKRVSRSSLVSDAQKKGNS